MEKLVRDKIPELSKAAGDGRIFRTAEEEEIPGLLLDKLYEEISEYKFERDTNPDNQVKITEELADVAEVFSAICKWHGIRMEDLNTVRMIKAERKGRFEDGVVLDLETNISRN